LDRVDVEDSFLTVAEVAEMLKLNQQTVRNWIDQGSLPALRVGRRVRIKRSDLDRVLDDAYSGGTTATRSESPATAEDFWGGELVAVAEPAPAADVIAPTADGTPSAEGGPPA
jgi:excisionase family DNA binding protein